MKKTGSVDLRTSQRGRKKKLSAEDLNQIKSLLAKQPTLTIHEITEQLHVKASEETVRRIVVRMGFTRKKLMIHASEQERPRCAEEEKRVETGTRTETGIERDTGTGKEITRTELLLLQPPEDEHSVVLTEFSFLHSFL